MSEKITSPEAREMAQLYQKYEPTIGMGALVTGAVIAMASVFYALSKVNGVSEDILFKQDYCKAVRRYADENHDGKVSPAERIAFTLDVLRDQPVLYVDDERAKYLEGGLVPWETLQERFKTYQPAERRK